MIGFTGKLLGVAAVNKALDNLVDDKDKENLLQQVSMDIEASAKRYSPVDTGRLRGSIHTNRKSSDLYIVGTDVEYAIHQEFGTRYQPGTAFLRPAMSDAQRKFAGKNIEFSFKSGV